MKLNKNNLRKALYALIDVMISGSSEFSEKAINALNDDALEIEGYTRDKWTRFDPKDPKTFPPVDKYLLLAQNERILGVYVPCPEWIVVDWRCVGELKHKGETVTHWRPLPPPPGKEEM